MTAVRLFFRMVACTAGAPRMVRWTAAAVEPTSPCHPSPSGS